MEFYSLPPYKQNSNTFPVYFPDPDLILPRCEIEFTPMMIVSAPGGAMQLPPPGSIVSGSCLMGGGGGGGSIVGASLNHYDVKN